MNHCRLLKKCTASIKFFLVLRKITSVWWILIPISGLAHEYAPWEEGYLEAAGRRSCAIPRDWAYYCRRASIKHWYFSRLTKVVLISDYVQPTGSFAYCRYYSQVEQSISKSRITQIRRQKNKGTSILYNHRSIYIIIID